MARRRLNRYKLVRPDKETVERYRTVFEGRTLALEPEKLPEISSRSLFNNTQKLFLDMGCGRGEFLIEQASNNHNNNYVGIDLDFRSLDDAVFNAAKEKLDNIHFIRADLKQVLKKVPDNSIETFYLLFPSPHMKAKFRKKDVITDSFLSDLNKKLVDDGTIHFTTDHEEYFKLKMELFENYPSFKIVKRTSGFEGGITWYQKIWEKHGLETYRAEFVKKN